MPKLITEIIESPLLPLRISTDIIDLTRAEWSAVRDAALSIDEDESPLFTRIILGERLLLVEQVVPQEFTVSITTKEEVEEITAAIQEMVSLRRQRDCLVPVEVM